MNKELFFHSCLARRSIEPDHVVLEKRLGVCPTTARKILKDPARLTIRQLRALKFTPEEVGGLV
jgi:hypothetical protein